MPGEGDKHVSDRSPASHAAAGSGAAPGRPALTRGVAMIGRAATHLGLLAAATLAIVGCTTTPDPVPEPRTEAREDPIVLSDPGKRYLENVYLYGCATEYLPYPRGKGPPVPARTEEEWAEREEELTACRREVADEYTRLETVRMMTWNGTRHSMSDGEMQGIVRHGDAFLQEYVSDLMEVERARGLAGDPESALADRS